MADGWPGLWQPEWVQSGATNSAGGVAQAAITAAAAACAVEIQGVLLGKSSVAASSAEIHEVHPICFFGFLVLVLPYSCTSGTAVSNLSLRWKGFVLNADVHKNLPTPSTHFNLFY